jgi:hypothetical protein
MSSNNRPTAAQRLANEQAQLTDMAAALRAEPSTTHQIARFEARGETDTGFRGST